MRERMKPNRTVDKVPEGVKRLRPQFGDFLRESALVKLGEAPKSFDFASSLAVDDVARHADVQALAQVVQDALGQLGLFLILDGDGTWQGDQRQARLPVQDGLRLLRPEVDTIVFILVLLGRGGE